VALAGSVTADDAALAKMGIDAALSICNGPISLEESMRQARPLLTDAAERTARLIALGQAMPDSL
jgi:glycerate kinase